MAKDVFSALWLLVTALEDLLIHNPTSTQVVLGGEPILEGGP